MRFPIALENGMGYDWIPVKRGEEMATTYSSPRIARELGKQFADQATTVRVEMKYTREIGRFIQKVVSAHQRTARSKQVFK
jgi:hypothetical protein